MILTGPAEVVTVICSLQTEGAVWFLTDAARLYFPASVYINAVKARIEANRLAVN